MKEKISQYTLDSIRNNHKNIMLINQSLVVIDTFDFIIEKERGMWSKNVHDVIYLTKLDIFAYNSKGRYIGVFDNKTSMNIIKYHNLNACRGKWLDIKEQIEAFGFEIINLK